ncbi:FecCD family ABC transporter permease [Aquamicrobium segne]|uniref:FecCD family ABC transporter permease n=1 Tax=Aquamicrobium segne TaxID=469547 RepID=A0ABW0GW80_9HYPH
MRDAKLRLSLIAILLPCAALASLQFGSYSISLLDSVRTFAGYGTAQQELVLFSIRLPRICVVILAGAALALSGATLQATSRNILADPGIIGLTSGAGLTVILLLYAQQEGIGLPFLSKPLAAACGAFVASLLVYGLAVRRGSLDPDKLLLCGIAVSAGLSAATLVISLRLDRKLYELAVVWMSGSTAGKGWHDVWMMLIWLVPLMPLLLMQAKALDVLMLGDTTAKGLGLDLETRRLFLLVLAVGLAGTAVAAVGGIGFIGLLGAHIARRIAGPTHALLLPAAAAVGAILLVLSDTVGRTMLAPVEVPAGGVVALIGAPYFLHLMTRSRKRFAAK